MEDTKNTLLKFENLSLDKKKKFSIKARKSLPLGEQQEKFISNFSNSLFNKDKYNFSIKIKNHSSYNSQANISPPKLEIKDINIKRKSAILSKKRNISIDSIFQYPLKISKDNIQHNHISVKKIKPCKIKNDESKQSSKNSRNLNKINIFKSLINSKKLNNLSNIDYILESPYRGIEKLEFRKPLIKSSNIFKYDNKTFFVNINNIKKNYVKDKFGNAKEIIAPKISLKKMNNYPITKEKNNLILNNGNNRNISNPLKNLSKISGVSCIQLRKMIDYSLSHGIGIIQKNTIKLKKNSGLKRKINNICQIKNISPVKYNKKIYINKAQIQKSLKNNTRIIDDMKFQDKYTMVNFDSKENNGIKDDSIYYDSIISDDCKNYLLMDDKILNFNKDIGSFSNSSSDNNNGRYFFKNQKIRDVIEGSNEKKFY